MAYQKIVRVLRETKKLDQVHSLSGPEYVWRMAATHCPSWSSASGRDSSGNRLTAMSPNLIVFMIFRRKGWSTDQIWLTNREQWPSSRQRPLQPRRLVAMSTSLVGMTVGMAVTTAGHGTDHLLLMTLPTFRSTVQLPSPKGTSISIRDLVTLTPPLILMIICPIGMLRCSSVLFLAVRIPRYTPGDLVMCFVPFRRCSVGHCKGQRLVSLVPGPPLQQGVLHHQEVGVGQQEGQVWGERLQATSPPGTSPCSE